MRAFAALDIPDDAKKEISEKYTSGRDFLNPSKEMHLTVLFIESLADRHTAAVSESIARVCSGNHSFMISACGVGEFGHGRVVYLKMTNGFRNILELHRVLYTEINRITALRAEEKEFFPHITLGRPFSRDRNRAAEYTTGQAWSKISFACKGISFFKSRNDGGSYVHTIIASYPFAP
jgi:2'-5' RNA ligase